jgi:hypothetical protein
MSTTPRTLASVVALIAALGALYGWVSAHPAPVGTAPTEASEPAVWTAEDFPVRVSTIEGGVRVEIAGYVDLDCQGCTDDAGVLLAERIMSKTIAESLPVSEPLDVSEPMPGYVPAILLDNGWYGVEGDGCECLYPPTFTRPISS